MNTKSPKKGKGRAGGILIADPVDKLGKCQVQKCTNFSHYRFSNTKLLSPSVYVHKLKTEKNLVLISSSRASRCAAESVPALVTVDCAVHTATWFAIAGWLKKSSKEKLIALYIVQANALFGCTLKWTWLYTMFTLFSVCCSQTENANDCTKHIQPWPNNRKCCWRLLRWLSQQGKSVLLTKTKLTKKYKSGKSMYDMTVQVYQW